MQVYLVKADNGLYKIGLSRNTQNRMAQFSGLPFGVELVHVITTNNAARLEKYLHNTYKHKRVRAEWFVLDSDDVKTIKSVTKAIYPKSPASDILPNDYEATRPRGNGWRIEIHVGGNGNKYYSWRRSHGGKRQFRYGGTCVNNGKI